MNDQLAERIAVALERIAVALESTKPAPVAAPQPPRPVPAPTGVAPVPGGGESWRQFAIPFGKKAGVLLGSMSPRDLRWWCENFEARDADFREALEAAAQANRWKRPAAGAAPPRKPAAPPPQPELPSADPLEEDVPF